MKSVLSAAALVAVLLVTPAGAGNKDAASRALVRCQQTVAREGLSYSNQLQWRVARCLRPIAECTTFGSDPSSCREATMACAGIAGDLNGLQEHLCKSVASACSTVPMDRLMSSGFAREMGSCTPNSMDDFGHCLAGNLRRELGDVLGQILPSACDLLARFGVVVPPELCAGPPVCQTTSTVATTTTSTTTTSTSTTTTSTTVTTTTTTTTTTLPMGRLYCNGVDGVQCPSGMVCDVTDPLCSQATMPGACVPVPPAVCDPGSPSCGCDGVTYASNCERVKAGIVEAHAGACDAAPSPCSPADPTCPQGQFCDFAPGDCGEGAMGVCHPMTAAPCDLCTAFGSGPVCGCDLITYPSDCARQAAGISKFFDGSCG